MVMVSGLSGPGCSNPQHKVPPMRQPHMRKLVAVVALTSLFTSGCFGTFQMTRDVYSWNQKVAGDNKWSRELVFLLVGPIVPVYSVAMLLDAVFVNSVEFWTGKNPMTSSTTKIFDKDGTKVAQTLKADKTGRTEVLEVRDATGVVSTTTMFQPTGSQLVTSTTKFADGRIETRSVSRDEATAASAAATRK